MNSFKKIALAMVAAMTLGTVVATPASAAVMTVAVTLGAANTDKSSASAIATPAALPVPSDNKIDVTDALKFVATVDTGTVVTVVTTNATIVSALHTDVTYYVQGTAGLINNLTVSAPASGAAGTKQDILVTATDVFGNKISGKSITATVFAATATLASATASTGSTLSDFGVAKFSATLPTTGTRALIMFAPTTAGEAEAADVVGLTARTLAPFAEVTVRDLVSELAAEKAAKDAAIAALAAEKAAHDATKAADVKVLADAKAAADAALAAEKAASAKALADAKTASDAALAAKDATIAKLTADNAVALKSIKDAFNALAKQWNAKNPKAKVKYVK